jgi:hypothetical protein
LTEARADDLLAGKSYHLVEVEALLALVRASGESTPHLFLLDDPIPRRGDDSTAVSMGAFTFDVAKIHDRASVLFPFLTPGLSLEHFALTPRREVHDSLGNPFAPPRGARPHAGLHRPPLLLSDAALQSVTASTRSERRRSLSRVEVSAETPDRGGHGLVKAWRRTERTT